jgi:hypothetical protein
MKLFGRELGEIWWEKIVGGGVAVKSTQVAYHKESSVVYRIDSTPINTNQN